MTNHVRSILSHLALASILVGIVTTLVQTSWAKPRDTYTPSAVCTYEQHEQRHLDCVQSGLECVGNCYIDRWDMAYCQFNLTSGCSKREGTPILGRRDYYSCDDNNPTALCECNLGNLVNYSAIPLTGDICLY